jgi:hypothetical protein
MSDANRGRALALVGAGMLLTAFAAGCGDKPTTESAEPELGPIPTVRTAADIVLPLDAYLPSEAARQTVAKAAAILLEQCMAEFGLEFHSGSDSGSPEPEQERNARRYFVIDPAAAAIDGYHPSAALRQAQAALQDQRTANSAPISADVINVMEGKGPSTYNGRKIPDGGCSKESARRMGGGHRVDTVTIDVQLMQVESYNRMQQDSRVVTASRAWSTCMHEQGFEYPSPRAANDDQRWSGDEASDAEIATAVADVACKLKTNIAGTMLAVETAYQRRLVDQHVAELAELKALFEDEAAGAVKVIGSGGR